jgi:hypothetical protein
MRLRTVLWFLPQNEQRGSGFGEGRVSQNTAVPPRNDTEDHIMVTCIVLIRLRVGICQQGEMPGERLR